MSRRQAISWGSTAATAASISAASRFWAMRVAGTASPGAMARLSPGGRRASGEAPPGRSSWLGPQPGLARPGAVARAEQDAAERAVIDRLGEAGVESNQDSVAHFAGAHADEARARVRPLAAARLVGELGAALDRHLDVDQRGVVGTRGEQVGGHGRGPGAIAFEAELVEDAGEGIEHVVAVVDDEDAAGRRVARLVVVGGVAG